MVTPPSTKMKDLPPHVMTSGGKYVGAAVLARTSCHNGSFVLHAGCAGSLYFANGLLQSGQANRSSRFASPEAADIRALLLRASYPRRIRSLAVSRAARCCIRNAAGA